MKKLSIAAILISGMVSMASATTLSSVLKSTQISGQGTIKYYDESDRNFNRLYEVDFDIKAITPVSENMNFIVAFTSESDIYSNSNENINSNLTNNLLYLNGIWEGVAYNIGKIPVITPITGKGHAEAHGMGAVASYKVSDVTFVAGYVDSITGTDKIDVSGNDIKTLGAVYNSQNAVISAWYFNIKNMINNEYVLNAKLKLESDNTYNSVMNFTYAHAKLDNAFQTVTNAPENTQKYFNISIKTSTDKSYLYAGFAKTSSDGGVVSLDSDSPVSKVLPTEQITGIANTVDHSAYYISFGYSITPKLTGRIAYSNINDKTSVDNDQNEKLIGFDYKYSKRMNFRTYYSILDQDNDTDNNEFYLEASYKF